MKSLLRLLKHVFQLRFSKRSEELRCLVLRSTSEAGRKNRSNCSYSVGDICGGGYRCWFVFVIHELILISRNFSLYSFTKLMSYRYLSNCSSRNWDRCHCRCVIKRSSRLVVGRSRSRQWLRVSRLYQNHVLESDIIRHGLERYKAIDIFKESQSFQMNYKKCSPSKT